MSAGFKTRKAPEIAEESSPKAFDMKPKFSTSGARWCHDFLRPMFPIKSGSCFWVLGFFFVKCFRARSELKVIQMYLLGHDFRFPCQIINSNHIKYIYICIYINIVCCHYMYVKYLVSTLCMIIARNIYTRNKKNGSCCCSHACFKRKFDVVESEPDFIWFYKILAISWPRWLHDIHPVLLHAVSSHPFDLPHLPRHHLGPEQWSINSFGHQTKLRDDIHRMDTSCW